MSLTAIWDTLRKLERSFNELRTEMNRLPVRDPKVSGFSVAVFELVDCDDPTKSLFLDNAEIASHAPGGVDEDLPVAAIMIDGVVKCWRVVERAAACKTGTCAVILGWGADCNVCVGCFRLSPCDESSPVIVSGIEWMEFVDKVIVIDAGAGPKCYAVAAAETCAGVDEDVEPGDILVVMAACETCGCYELENCLTEAPLFVTDDLAGMLGLEPGDLIGKVVILGGVCWTVVAFHSPCEESAPDNFGLITAPPVRDDCDSCCFELTPCPGQEGSPTAFKVNLEPDDYDLTELINEDGTSNGKAIMLASYVCYTVARPANCTGAVTGLPSMLEVFDSCECCAITCWSECGAETPTFIRTYSDLCEYWDYNRWAVIRAEDGKCYVREPSSGTCGTPTIVPFTVEDARQLSEDGDPCVICVPKFRLVPACGGCSPGGDCGDAGSGGGGGLPGCSDTPEPPDPLSAAEIVTAEETLAAFVGRYVKFNGVCYRVELDESEDAVEYETLCYSGPFATCGDCVTAPTLATFATRVYFDGSTLKQKVETWLLDGKKCGTGVCTIGVVGGGGAIGVGCGLDSDELGIYFDAAAVAGPGLEAIEPCKLQVDVGCGLEITLDGQVAVKVSDLVGVGLILDAGGTGECDALAVNYGCGLTIASGALVVDPVAVSGEYLEPDPSTGPCAIKVATVTQDVVTDVSLAIVSGELKLTVTKKTLTILAVEDTTGTDDAIEIIDCDEV